MAGMQVDEKSAESKYFVIYYDSIGFSVIQHLRILLDLLFTTIQGFCRILPGPLGLSKGSVGFSRIM